MSKRTILGVHLLNRFTEAPKFQELITQYGCIIKARIGLHDVTDSICSTSGVILLDLLHNEQLIGELESKLGQFEGIEVQKMVFEE